MSYGWEVGFGSDAPHVVAIGPTSDVSALRRDVIRFVVTRDLTLPEEELDERVDAASVDVRISPALDGVLSAVDTATTVIVERGYYDLDARSEEAWTITRQFRFSPTTHDRLHFFSAAVSKADFESATAGGDRTQKLQDGYLGYCVLRSNNLGHAVGRTMVAPPLTHPTLKKPVDFRLRVRTRVREELTLCGVPLAVEAVPFMQQDGTVTRCAHAVAWMTHFSAVLRGTIPRVAIGELHPPIRDRSGSLYQRQYPSPGLTIVQLEDSLINAGLPPELLGVLDLAVDDRSAWPHRKQLMDITQIQWHREAFTATICRYLNSGIPVIVTIRDHVQLICGYLRSSHLIDGDDDSSLHSFILSDDSIGPYIIENADELLRELADQDFVIIPLPNDIALLGSEAEWLAVNAVRHNIDAVLEAALSRGLEDLSRIVTKTASQLDSRELAVRTYLSESNAFKLSFGRRCSNNPEACRIVRLARLPKYIWVVEITERDQRKAGGTAHGPVIGEVLIDATSAKASAAETLLLHVPGYVVVRDPILGSTSAYTCPVNGYMSGRWAHDPDVLASVAMSPRIAKTAGVNRM